MFGFSQDEVPLILREFGKCGDIRQFGTFGEGGGVNWIHIQFAVSRVGGPSWAHSHKRTYPGLHVLHDKALLSKHAPTASECLGAEGCCRPYDSPACETVEL